MGLWDQLKTTVGGWNDSLQTQAKKFNNREFAEASMATCALIAAADGSIGAEERRKTASLIASNPVLQNFDSKVLQEKFNYYCDKLSQDFDFGKIEALQAVAKLKKKEDQGRAVVQIGIIIGGADGNFDTGEKKVLREVCHSLGIDPAQFEL